MTKAPPTIARTPLHHWHAAHGGRFVDRDGWQVVSAYTSAEREAELARAGLGLADISAFAKVRLRGQRPEQKSHGRQAEKVEAASENWLACRLTDNHRLWLASRPHAGAAPRISFPGMSETDATSDYAAFVLLGPCLDEVLRRMTSLDLRSASFPASSCAETALARVEALLVRSAEFSVPSMRILVAWDLGEYVWERLIEAGRDLPITPLGLDALDRLV